MLKLKYKYYLTFNEITHDAITHNAITSDAITCDEITRQSPLHYKRIF